MHSAPCTALKLIKICQNRNARIGAYLLDNALDGEEDAANSEASIDNGDEVVERESHLPAKLVEGPAVHIMSDFGTSLLKDKLQVCSMAKNPTAFLPRARCISR